MGSSQKRHDSKPAPTTAPDARGEPSQDVFAAAQEWYDRLEQLERRSLQLAHRDGMAVGEISEVLGEPPGTIRQALRDGLLKLSPDGR